MYEVIMLNEVGEKFTKIFSSEFLFNKFLNKAKRSKKIIILSYGKI